MVLWLGVTDGEMTMFFCISVPVVRLVPRKLDRANKESLHEISLEVIL